MDKPCAPELAGALVWLRRDLRVQDHAALSHALRSARQVWCVFLFDDDILAGLPRADRRVEFIREALVGVDAELRALGASHGVEGVGLLLRRGRAAQEIPALASQLGVQAVFASHDDEPQSLARDAQVRGKLSDLGVALHTSKDHVVFERSELLTQAGRPFAVFTPYKNAWLAKCEPQHLAPHAVAAHASALAPLPAGSAGLPSLSELGFEATNLHELHLPSGAAGAQEMLADFLERIDHYHETRDYPAVKGPSYLSLHLRFGTVSVRQLARGAGAARRGLTRGRGLVVRADLARLLSPGAAPPSSCG